MVCVQVDFEGSWVSSDLTQYPDFSHEPTFDGRVATGFSLD
jgi:hypothetical protein